MFSTIKELLFPFVHFILLISIVGLLISYILTFDDNHVVAFVGRVGKLSIKIPWKKLGWDPIIIILEDVYICVSPRDDKEVIFSFLLLSLHR